MIETQTPAGDGAIPTPPGAGGEDTSKQTTPPAALPPEVDYKKKFSESTTENQRIAELNAQLLKDKEELEAKLAKANETPSEEELSSKYPDWDLKDGDEQERLRREEAREKRLRILEEKTAWEDDFKSLVKQSEFSSLREREDEFKSFAYKYPKSVDLTTLAKSFLYDSPKPPAPPEKEQPPRPGLEPPTGGSKEVQGSGMTLEDITRLRTENPKLYLKMIREGKIKDIPEK